MKKRKFPAGLVIALVVLFGGAGAYSLINTRAATMSPEEAARIEHENAMREAAAKAPKPDPKAASATPSKEAIRQQAQAATQGGARTRGPRPGDEAAPAGTSILAPKPSAPYKPVPNESATSSQWFEKR